MHRHHYLVALWDGGGSVPPELAAARRLVERGHRVTIIADPTIRDGALATGAAFRPWRRGPHRTSGAPDDDLIKDWETKNPITIMHRIQDRLVAGRAADYLADVREALAEDPADAVVASFVIVGALLAAESAGLPVAMLCPNPYPFGAEGVPPFGTGWLPARTPLGRARDRVVGALTTRLWDRALRDLAPLRRELGLAPVEHTFDVLHRADRMLVLTSARFDLPGRFPANVRHVGPQLDDPTWVAPWTPPPGDAPLVLVGLSSTFMDQARVLQRVVDAVAALPVRAVVTTGPSIDPASISAPPSVQVVASAPHREVLRHASAVVTHGGHGTLIKALAAGVPVLVVPMGRDQPDNAARAVVSGAALRLPPRAGTARIRSAVGRLLAEPSFRERAQHLGEVLRAEATSDALVDELEAMVRERRPAPCASPAG